MTAALLLVGCVTQNLAATPFISEIFLPGADAYPGSGIEVSGIGEDGATLLVIDAQPDGRLIVRRKYEILAPGTALLADLGTLEALQKNTGSSTTGVELPAFSLPLSDPIALAVFNDTTALSRGTSLNVPGNVSLSLAASPIVDWVVLSPEATQSAAEASVFSVSDELAEALGIDHLDRPIAPTSGVTTLARPSVAALPQLDWLLPGSIEQGISGASANLFDFPTSPGLANPSTAELPGITPEPTSLAILCVSGLWLVRRGPKPTSRCEPSSRCL